MPVISILNHKKTPFFKHFVFCLKFPILIEKTIEKDFDIYHIYHKKNNTSVMINETDHSRLGQADTMLSEHLPYSVFNNFTR